MWRTHLKTDATKLRHKPHPPLELLGETRLSRQAPSVRATLTISLAALGIVFGDLGTSPLYALQEAFHGERGVSPTPENVIGCL